MCEREPLVPDTVLKDGNVKKEKNITYSNGHRMIFVDIFMFGIGDLYIWGSCVLLDIKLASKTRDSHIHTCVMSPQQTAVTMHVCRGKCGDCLCKISFHHHNMFTHYGTVIVFRWTAIPMTYFLTIIIFSLKSGDREIR